MARKISLSRRFVLLASMAAAANAWTFVFTDTHNSSHVKTGYNTTSCAKMDMERGGYYNWDPEDRDFCINMFPDEHCNPDNRNGYSCPIWPKRHLEQKFVGSWLVNHEKDALDPISSTTTPSSSETSSAAHASDPTVTVTSKPEKTSAEATESAVPSEDDDDDGDGGSSLSGGAIAGVVVGVLAGVAIMAVFGFLAIRRRRQQNRPVSPKPPADVGSPPPPPPSTGGGDAAPKYQAYQPYHHPSELDSAAASPGTNQSPVPTYTPYPPEKADVEVGYGASRPPMPELANTTPVHSQAVELDAAEAGKASS